MDFIDSKIKKSYFVIKSRILNKEKEERKQKEKPYYLCDLQDWNPQPLACITNVYLTAFTNTAGSDQVH